MSYKLINSQFTKKYIYQFGTGGGYCAEMIFILKSIQMCLYHELEFCIGKSKHPKGISVRYGWQDYFEPLFLEHEGLLLEHLNRSNFFGGRLPILKTISRLLLNSVYGKNIYMFDNPSWKYPKVVFNDSLSIEGDEWTTKQTLIKALFRYKNEVLEEILLYKSKYNTRFDKPYIGIHIRRGDKLTESPYIDVEKYVKVIQQNNLENLPIYLASDDFSVLSEFRSQLNNNAIIKISVNKNNKGYYQPNFNNLSNYERWRRTVFFQYELELLINSTYFIGASPSNVYYWVRYNRANKNIFDADN